MLPWELAVEPRAWRRRRSIRPAVPSARGMLPLDREGHVVDPASREALVSESTGGATHSRCGRAGLTPKRGPCTVIEYRATGSVRRSAEEGAIGHPRTQGTATLPGQRGPRGGGRRFGRTRVAM